MNKYDAETAFCHKHILKVTFFVRSNNWLTEGLGLQDYWTSAGKALIDVKSWAAVQNMPAT